MNAIIFIIVWVGITAAVFAAAFYLSKPSERKTGYRGKIPGGTRALIVLGAAFIVIGIPALVLTETSDRMPSGAGTYTLNSSKSEREGRAIFRETCASCHTLTAANARGVYGPDLDKQLGAGGDPKATAARVESAIKTGGTTGKQMPANLLQGEDAALVSEYVAAVAGK